MRTDRDRAAREVGRRARSRARDVRGDPTPRDRGPLREPSSGRIRSRSPSAAHGSWPPNEQPDDHRHHRHGGDHQHPHPRLHADLLCPFRPLQVLVPVWQHPRTPARGRCVDRSVDVFRNSSISFREAHRRDEDDLLTPGDIPPVPHHGDHMRGGCMRRSLIAALVVALAAMFVPAAGASSASTQAPERGNGSDIVRTPNDLKAPIRLRGAKVANPTAKTPPQVGDVRTWLGLDDVAGGFYTKNFTDARQGRSTSRSGRATGTRTLNGVTTTDLNFQDGDCRNGERTTVTDAQVRFLINQFDRNIYPIESERLQRPAATERRECARSRRSLGLPPDVLHRRRRRHRRADRQRARRQPLRPEQHAGVLVHRRVLLLGAERVLQPQRHDDRRVRLVAPHRSEPAERAGAR